MGKHGQILITGRTREECSTSHEVKRTKKYRPHFFETQREPVEGAAARTRRWVLVGKPSKPKDSRAAGKARDDRGLTLFGVTYFLLWPPFRLYASKTTCSTLVLFRVGVVTVDLLCVGVHYLSSNLLDTPCSKCESMTYFSTSS